MIYPVQVADCFVPLDADEEIVCLIHKEPAALAMPNLLASGVIAQRTHVVCPWSFARRFGAQGFYNAATWVVPVKLPVFQRDFHGRCCESEGALQERRFSFHDLARAGIRPHEIIKRGEVGELGDAGGRRRGHVVQAVS